MKKLIAAVIFATFFIAGAVQAQDVMEIVKKANHTSYYQGTDGRAMVDMEILDDQGRSRSRQFVILRRDDGEADAGQKFYVFFNKPADVKKMAFMVWKNIDRDDDRWLYLPALDLVKRIAASDERTSFVGSHFFYEDVSGRGIDEDTHELVEETDELYVIKSVPKDKGKTEFAYYKNWIHKSSSLPIKTEYYDDNDRNYRTYTALKVEMVDGHPTVTASQMSDNTGGGKTTMSYSEVKYDVGLPEDIFTERYLRKAPRQYLK
ncbi:outer membrane lipoprotein-sorting protein [Emcibacter sp.]|uniref:outer membrane lipoprotein-sorting protein n=1 Tax=Emcibacter sp. TaxID=1979954 RepID=UPI003A8FEDE7